MSGLLPMLKKEIREQLATYRLLIVGCVFVFFGISTPLLLKYTPEIIRLAGEGIPIDLPPPTAVQSLAEFISTMGQIGILIVVLVAMGAIANELQRGTAIMTLSKPISYGAFVTAKFIAISLTFLASLAAASVLCYIYTVLLIGSAGSSDFIGATLLAALFLLFCLALTLLLSASFKSAMAAGGMAIGILIAQAVLSTLPVIGDYFPGKLLGWGSNLLSGAGQTHWWALGITVAATIACLLAAQYQLKRKEL